MSNKLKLKAAAIKAERDLWWCIVIESGHDVGVGELFQRELCSVVLHSIAMPNGSWRESIRENGFGQNFARDCLAKPAPYQQDEGCPIIDGMAAVQFLSSASAAKPFGEWGS